MLPLPPHPYVVKGLVSQNRYNGKAPLWEQLVFSLSNRPELKSELNTTFYHSPHPDYQTIVTILDYGTNQESMIWVPYLETLAKRPHALNTPPLSELPRSYQNTIPSIIRRKRVFAIFADGSSKEWTKRPESWWNPKKDPHPINHLMITFEDTIPTLWRMKVVLVLKLPSLSTIRFHPVWPVL